jgi:predicted SAM-dependent methyltransferase
MAHRSRLNMTEGRQLPWGIKIALKLFLARLPLSHKTWNKLGVFKHGEMQEFSYARDVFIRHLKAARMLDKDRNMDKTIMELGPGESLFSALLARSYRFKQSVLLDVGDFTLPTVQQYQKFSRWLKDEGLATSINIDTCDSIRSMLTALHSQFFTHGLQSLENLQGNSLDLIFSHTVLQHIHRRDFAETVRQLWRVLNPGGVSTHVVDFKDMLGGSLNSLRFSDRFWERALIVSSGFYTNRIRFRQMIRIFESQGFKVEVLEKEEWSEMPLGKKYLNSHFRLMDDDELKVSGAMFNLYKPMAHL